MATLSFHGKPIHTCGELPKMGSKVPDFELVNGQLKNITLKNYHGKRKILSIVPSLDTPTCATSTRIFNQKSAKLNNTVVLVISEDLPFAQGRFCETEAIKDVIALSCFRSNFAKDYGLRLTDSLLKGLTARAVIVLNEKDVVIYSQFVSEISDEPDYKGVLAVLSDDDVR
ncbi:MAG: thiol peroxidase [Methylococcales bacterium]|nr:thiol peroxidase [Methylococcales bacterium]